MQVKVVGHQLGVLVAQPPHHHLLRDPLAGAQRTKEVAERVQPAVGKADPARRGRKPRGEWPQDVPNQDVADRIRL